jgi:hypothetical protein
VIFPVPYVKVCKYRRQRLFGNNGGGFGKLCSSLEFSRFVDDLVASLVPLPGALRFLRQLHFCFTSNRASFISQESVLLVQYRLELCIQSFLAGSVRSSISSSPNAERSLV